MHTPKRQENNMLNLSCFFVLRSLLNYCIPVRFNIINSCTILWKKTCPLNEIIGETLLERILDFLYASFYAQIK